MFSAMALITDIAQCGRHVRKVPTRDSCIAANSGDFDRLCDAFDAQFDFAAQRAAAQGTQQVSSKITDVQSGTSETGSASSQVLLAAQSLSAESYRLKLEVGKFLKAVKVA
jgi:methyl-accepting chemotaxis protein